MSKEIASAYLHISNSGVSFAVVDEGNGPCIRISSSVFGNNQIKQDVFVTKVELSALAEMFAYAATKNYSEEYCHVAKLSSTKPLDLLEDMTPPGDDNRTFYQSLANPFRKMQEQKTPKQKTPKQKTPKWTMDEYKKAERGDLSDKNCGDDNG